MAIFPIVNKTIKTFETSKMIKADRLTDNFPSQLKPFNAVYFDI